MDIDRADWEPRILSILRMMAGLLFFSHALVKLWGYPSGAAPGQVPLMSLFGVAAILELVGGSLIILGLFTRPVAFVISGQMAFAYFLVHAPQGFFPIRNGGELAILYCFIMLYLSVAGGGIWSVDAYRGDAYRDAALRPDDNTA